MLYPSTCLPNDHSSWAAVSSTSLSTIFLLRMVPPSDQQGSAKPPETLHVAICGNVNALGLNASWFRKLQHMIPGGIRSKGSSDTPSDDLEECD